MMITENKINWTTKDRMDFSDRQSLTNTHMQILPTTYILIYIPILHFLNTKNKKA